MIRRGIQYLAWAALALSLAAWGASYSRSGWVTAPGGYGVLLDDGAVYLSPGRTLVAWRDLGAGVQRGPSSRVFSRNDVVVPLWLTFMLAAVALWAAWRFGFERRQRALAGCCVGCGYDLTGIDGVCPECGQGRPVA
ncbi:MAG: hypothetical protein IT431_00970 [Phycisphaerales bacterium]|nr:hypothetical protein [Phycisphaerales bacterium]